MFNFKKDKIMRKFIASFLTKLLEKVTQDSVTISVTPESVSTIPLSTEASESLKIIKPKEPKPKKIKGPKPPPLSPQ